MRVLSRPITSTILLSLCNCLFSVFLWPFTSFFVQVHPLLHDCERLNNLQPTHVMFIPVLPEPACTTHWRLSCRIFAIVSASSCCFGGFGNTS
ncbi:hypothetical protein BX600DRAFT_468672 [Xylariales sp. PMI_506]|nr:hypothetical protein BX600DRAFT_468672 [Xylariales sp. PMI_506]